MRLYLIDISYWLVTVVESIINLSLSILLLNRVFGGGVEFSLNYYGWAMRTFFKYDKNKFLKQAEANLHSIRGDFNLDKSMGKTFKKEKSDDKFRSKLNNNRKTDSTHRGTDDYDDLDLGDETDEDTYAKALRFKERYRNTRKD